MKKGRFNLLVGVVALSTLVGASCKPAEKQQPTLKDAFANKFYIGTAMNAEQIMGTDTATVEVIKANFNAIVPENCMKSALIQPEEGVFDFELPDKFVEFGQQNNMFVTGHCLVWHSQVPNWLFVDSLGNDVSPEVLTERMKTHIFTVMGRYKGKIKGWDVVNEAVEDNGSYRNSKFFQILGEDFIKLAFQFAHEADPDAELYYNDYSMAIPSKRDGVVAMVKKLQEQGVKIDGIGMQGHVSIDGPSIEEFEKSIEAFAALGVKVMITELDMSVLKMPDPSVGAEVSASFEYKQELNPYVNGLPDSINTIYEQRYLDFFKLFLKHQDKITRVTLWGVNDANSWKNDWPIFGRTDYCLLFDRQNQAKPVVAKIIEEALKQK